MTLPKNIGLVLGGLWLRSDTVWDSKDTVESDSPLYSVTRRYFSRLRIVRKLRVYY